MMDHPLFWLFVLPGLLLGTYAQSRIKINIAKYSQIRTRDGITGAEVARRLLDSQGLQAVGVESTPGMLSDHYDPRSKTLRLSQEVYFAPSVAAAGIAAHEAGHALQDAVDYFPLEARTYIVPLVQLASQVAPWLFIAGMMLQLPTLAWVGIILFGRILAVRLDHLAGGIQCQCAGAAIADEPRHHPGRRADRRRSERPGRCRLDLCGGSRISDRQLAVLRVRAVFPDPFR